MQLSGTSDDVLAGLLVDTLHHRVGLGETLQTFHQLGQISRVLGLYSHTHDRRHTELHDLFTVKTFSFCGPEILKNKYIFCIIILYAVLINDHYLHVVRVLESGDGSSLDKELVNADQTADVTAGHVLDGLDVTSHHEDGTLDGLLVQILFLAGSEVGSHDAGLLAGDDLAGEYTSESVETTLIGCRYHLAHVHHKRSFRVAGLKETNLVISINKILINFSL